MYIYLNEPNQLSHKIQINESDLYGYAAGECKRALWNQNVIGAVDTKIH